MATGNDGRNGTQPLAGVLARPNPRFTMVHPNNQYVDPRFFGMHYRRLPTDRDATPWHDFGQTSMRLWDTGTAWRYIEPRKGVFQWRRPDAYYSVAEAHGQRVLFTLGQAPDWATASPIVGEEGFHNATPPDNDSDWTDYVGAVVTRYAGNIDIEIWNEPSVRHFYSGTIARLVELTRLAYQTAKEIDPTCKVISPTVSSGRFVTRICQAGINDWIDAFGFHYSYAANPPEDWFAEFDEIKTAAAKNGAGDKPFWNTEYTYSEYYDESGRLIKDGTPMPGPMGAAYLARYLICNMVADVRRTFLYGMDFLWSAIRLIDYDNNSVELDPGRAFRYLSKLLAGSTIGQFAFDRWRGAFSVNITSGDKRYIAYWARDGQTAKIDTDGVATLTDVLGAPLDFGATYTVGNSPVFAELKNTS